MYLTIHLPRLLKYLFAAAGIALLIHTFGAAADSLHTDAVSLAAQPPSMTLIIDAGHGGEDGGALAHSGTKESELNLDIALRVEALAHFCGLQTVMTRTNDQIAYPDDASTTAARKLADQKQRIALINSIDNACLLSIHQNKYSTPAPRGPQVLYAATDGSHQFGSLTQQNLTAVLYPDNIRSEIEIPSGIYLFKKVRCPAILVECGFLSNPTECTLLEDPQYRLKTATVLAASCIQYCNTTRSADDI